MKIMVVGACGNIGSKLVPHLRSKGHEVVRVDMVQEYGDDYIQANITNLAPVYDYAIKWKPDVIYHLAAMVSRITCEKAPQLTIDYNISGTNNIIQLCKAVDAKMVNFSTSEVYGNIGGALDESRTDLSPNNRYGVSKLIAEKIIEYEVSQYDLKAVSIRPLMYYHEDESLGEHRSAFIRFAENLIKKKPITVHRNTSRSWMYLDDAVVALEKALNIDFYFAINIGNPDVISTELLARKMCEKLGLEFDEYVKLEELPDKMTSHKIPSLKRQKELLKFEPKISIDEGIDRVIKKVKERISCE